MANAFEEIDQYVIVMMENRSFDHVLGYLSLPPWNANREAVTAFSSASYHSPSHTGARLRPHRIAREPVDCPDPPHMRRTVWDHLAQRNGQFQMDGYVRAAHSPGQAVPAQPPCLGYLTPDHVPVTHYLASQFRVCDHWFTPIPTSTHPNRMMAISGWTPYDETIGQLADLPRTLLDFLTKHHVPWRAFARRASMFALVTRYTVEALRGSERFPPWSELETQWNAPVTGPCVWFLEPGYADVPWGDYPKEDDHAPLTCAPGQRFLREVYRIVRGNDARWLRTLMILVYDEHGGFFDSVPPLHIITRAPRVPRMKDQAVFPDFPCTGPRVPAILISPWVDAATTATAPLDHTSILKTLVERFGRDDRGYFVDSSGNECVFSRPVSIVTAEVTRTTPRDVPRDLPDPPAEPPAIATPDNAMTRAFRRAREVAKV
ncbi:MAG TPA: alkaline phosphatase family protein [Kofleriaceae bacterium]|nr:alkaline phosphatase family protein [Kofleriaceae bacterium]